MPPCAVRKSEQLHAAWPVWLPVLLLLIAADAKQLPAGTGYVVAWGDLEWTGTPPNTTQADIVKIAAGRYHALALSSRGQVYVWGDTEWNQTSAPPNALTHVMDIAAGNTHSLVLRSDGSIVAWGDNRHGECDVPAELRNGSARATAIAAGPGVSLAVVNGAVRAWGSNTHNQLELPDGATTDIVAVACGAGAFLAQKRNGTLLQWGYWSSLPDALKQGAAIGFCTISSGWDQAAAVAKDGSIAVWNAGDPQFPAVADQVSTPPPSNAPGTYQAVSAGYNYTMALTKKGHIVTWGFDSGNGVLSVPAAARSNVIAIVAGGADFGLALVAGHARSGYALAWGDDAYGAVSNVPALSGGIVKVSAGRWHALALTTHGRVLGWGDDSWNLTSGISQHMGTDKALDVSAGGGHNMVLLRHGRVRAWGQNDDGQCNVPDFGKVRVKAISAGGFHSLALLDNGTVVAWGASDPAHDWNQTHVPAAAKSGIIAVEAGAYSSLAVTANGTLIQWGNVMNDLPIAVKRKGVRTTPGSISAGYDQVIAILSDGSIAAWQVGHPDRLELLDQVIAAPPGRAKYVSAGYNFSAAVMETGEVVLWGGPSMALTLGSIPKSQALQVSAGERYAVALKARLPLPTGHVVAWGNLQWIGTPPITTQADIVKISAGRHHALALNSKGQVYVWGDTEWNQTSAPPDALTDVVDIAAGEVHSLVLLGDGTVMAWGDSLEGACRVPQQLKSGSAKATAIAAGSFVSLAVVDGGVIVWGRNSSGQLLVPKEAQSDVVAIAASMYTIIAQKADGTLVQWGAWSTLPAAAQKGVHKGPASFSPGWDQVAAVNKDGSIAVWHAGDPPDYPSIINQVSTPPPSNAPGTYKAVSAGYNFTMALTKKGHIVTWGFDNGNGVLSVPGAARSNVIAIAAGGEDFGLALVAGAKPTALLTPAPAPRPALESKTGHVYAWGYDGNGAISGVPRWAVSGGIVKISAGRYHALALTEEGRVLGWGDDSRSQTSGITAHVGSAVVVDVSAGGAHSMALLSDGTIRAWGSNDYGQGDVPNFNGVKVKAIAAGQSHSLALLSNGTVVAWGASEESVDWNQTRVPEAARTDIVAIAAGAYSSLATMSNGTLIQWGNVISDLPDVVKQKGVRTKAGSIAAGLDQMLAVLTDGSIATWQLGQPVNLGSLTQLITMPAGRAKYVSAGYNFSAAVMETGEVVVWGGQSFALTLGALPPSQVLQVAAGEDYAVALVADLPMPKGQPGLVRAWGSSVPEGGPDVGMSVVKASAGAEHVVELTANGTVRVWGNPNRTDLLNTSVVDGQVVVDIAAGQYHCLALLRNGTVIAWGAASHNTNQTHIPESLDTAFVTEIAAGYSHSLALTSAGSIVGWGSKGKGELNIPDNTTGNTFAIAAGAESSFAFIRSGSTHNSTRLVAWGDVGAVPEVVIQGAVSVAGGFNHSAALFPNGSVVAWTSSSTSNKGNTDQLLAVPSGMNFTVVAVNAYHSVALLASGQVVTWGAADDSVLTVPTAVASNKVLGVAAGLNFTVAIVDVDPTPMQHLNEAAGCNTAPNRYGYECNRALTGLPGDWQLSYTVNATSLPPSNLCTDSFQSAASSPQLPSGATHWIHFMLSSTARGWIAMSYPDVADRMYPAKAILGHTSSTGGVVSTYQLTGYKLPAPNNISWAINMGAVTSSDGRSVICFTQAAVLLNSTQRGRRLQEAHNDQVLDLSKDMRIQVASSPVPNTTQTHTVMGAVTIRLTTGKQAMTKLTLPESPRPAAVTGASPMAQRYPEPASSSPHLKAGVIAGVAVAAVAVVAAAIGLIGFWLMKIRQRQLPATKYQSDDVMLHYEQTDTTDSTSGVGLEAMAAELEGDVFLVATAKQYGWATSTALPGPLEAVEAGVNDTPLDITLQQETSGIMPATGGTNSVVRLSGEELRESLQLLSDGLLGRGATALVFKCVWPSRFGQNRLLAAKVVKNGFDGDTRALESFQYEANVLSSAQHPNVVRLYGYCLEPPTLCLILELLPTSLKDVLYKGMAYPGATGLFYTCLSAGQHQTILTHSRSHITMAPPTSGDTVMFTAHDGAVVIDVSQADGSVALQVLAANKSSAAGQTAAKDTQLNTGKPTLLPQSQLTCLQVVRLATDIAAGLAYLHSSSDLPIEDMDEEQGTHDDEGAASSTAAGSRIVHRDMKPANILINSQGVAKISDFGLARQHEHTTVATAHLGVGTLPYMAPELLVAARVGVYGQAVTNRVDIYSLAMMMWEMMSGCPPWRNMGEMAILAAVTQRQRPPLPGDMTFKDTAALQEVAKQPASPAAIPQLNKLIRACWNQRDLKRPQAKEVYAKLMVLLADMQGPNQAQSPTVTVINT